MQCKKTPDTTFHVERRLMSIEQASIYIGLGKSSAQKYLKKIGAALKIGRRTLYDKVIIDKAITKRTQ